MAKRSRRKPVRRKYQTKRWAEAHINNGVIYKLGTRAMEEVKPEERPPVHVKRGIAINQDRWSKHKYTGQTIPPTKRISEGLYTINKMIDDEFGDPWMDLQQRKRIIQKQNGEVRPVKWHEIIAQEDEFRKLALCFYGPKAVWVQVEYCVKKVRFSRVFNSSATAMVAHTRGQYSWRPYQEYRAIGV